MRKPWKNVQRSRHGVADLWMREVGNLLPRPFAHHAAAAEDLVMRLTIQRKLDKHRGCVNTVSFNSYGDTLVSGSDDQMVMLWNWETGAVRLCFYSGHSDNVFQARFMPYTDDRTIVTCGADGEVRLAKIPESGEVLTTLLGEHEGRAHKLAIEPGSPYIFYSCGEDGLVQHFDLRTNSGRKLLVCTSLLNKEGSERAIHLNAITIDPRNPNLFAVGGADAYARVYDIRKYKWDGSSDCGRPTNCYCPPHLINDKNVAITGLAFSQQSELLTSYNDEHIYLFHKNQGLGPNPASKSPKSTKKIDSGEESKSMSTPPAENVDQTGPRVYKGHHNCETVKGVSFFGPNCEYVASGSDCGRLFIWRKSDGKLLRAMDGDRYVVNCIEPHPHSPLLASSGIEHDVKIWAPNAMEPSAPVNIDELKARKRRNKLWQLSLPDDLVRQVAGWRRRQRATDDQEEGFANSAELLNIILRFSDGYDGSSDDDDEPSGSRGDCVVN